jgi:hypothetical protein
MTLNESLNSNFAIAYKNLTIDVNSHENIRDEQFWFTTAVVGFNALLLGSETSKLSNVLVIAFTAIVSAFGAYLILTRWIHAANRAPLNPPDAKHASAIERLTYSGKELCQCLKSLPYVFAEFSGSLFYLCLIVLSFLSVLAKVLIG